MKLKSIVIAIVCLFLLGVSANVFAVTDSTGEALTSGVDILSASVVTSSKVDDNPPDTASIGITMAAGSHLPGAIIFDFDVDNDTATGGGSVITGIPNMTCRDEYNVAQVCKADAGGGFDFHLTLLLRNQSDDAALANCSGCYGGSSRCTERGTIHDCGTAGTCYEMSDECSTGSDCYLIADRCGDTCLGVYAYPMTTLCDDAPAATCARGYTKGEWSVGFGQNGQVMNGNINLGTMYDPTNGETTICAEIPWAVIVTEAYIRILNAGDPEHPLFNVVTAAANAPKFQVTALHNLRYSGDNKQDFTQTKLLGEPNGFYLAVKDWMPDTARVADGEYNAFDPCNHNSEGGYGDLDVDANDVTEFLQEFGRGGFNKPCPNCKN